MHTQRWIVPLLGFLAVPVFGQDPDQDRFGNAKFEFFIGYSHRSTLLKLEPTFTTVPLPEYPGSFPARWENSNGWAMGFTFNPHEKIGLTADLAGQYGRALGPIIPPIVGSGGVQIRPELHNSASYQFLFGPKFSVRSGRFSHFAHTLFGGFHSAGGVPRTDFAMAYGGGVDIKLTDRFSVRAIQADWIPVKHHTWEHHIRMQSGIIFNFGR